METVLQTKFNIGAGFYCGAQKKCNDGTVPKLLFELQQY